jgi:Uncharacterized protein/domain associated with GTPases
MSAGAAWNFWKTVQTVSPRAVEDEANALFKLAIVGNPEARRRVREAFLTERATDEEREEAAAYLREFDEAPDADTARAYAFTLYPPDDPAQPLGARGENSVPLSGTVEQVAAQMIEQKPTLTVALARRFPLFRQPAANKIIRETAKVNAGVALVSALPGVLPISAIFLPASSVADVILLTKNQVVMIMRIAAAHGRKPAYTKQIKELIGTVGAALGWRTLVREVAGLVPAGVGVAIKASIAYSGTVAAGKAAYWFYHTGKKPTPEAIRTAFDESKDEAKRAVKDLRGNEPAGEPVGEPADAPAVQ